MSNECGEISFGVDGFFQFSMEAFGDVASGAIIRIREMVRQFTIFHIGPATSIIIITYQDERVVLRKGAWTLGECVAVVMLLNISVLIAGFNVPFIGDCF